MSDPARETLVQRLRALSAPLAPEPTDTEPRLQRLGDIRCVLFDIYGTLMISASGDIGLGGDRNQDQAFREALEAAGLPASGLGGEFHGGDLLKETIREFHRERQRAGVEFPEVDIVAVWERALARLPMPHPAADTQPGPEMGPDRARLERAAVEYECRVNPIWPMPGLADTLAMLRESRRVMGVVSNAQFFTPLLFEALLGSDLEALGFEPAFCAWSYRRLEAKPSTRLYQEVLDRLQRQRGITPGQVLYVGNDRRNDIWPAARLGCRTALFAGDRRSLRWRDDDPRCNRMTPDLIITELEQLSYVLN